MRGIQQQYYTRSNNGIYSRTEGYDTVAKSKDLCDSFVRDTLHKICVYKAPYGSRYSDNIIQNRFPDAMTCVQPSTGELIIGRAVYKDLDFSGSRETYFVHNYIIPEEDKDSYIKDISRLLYIKDFAEEQGASEELKELEELSLDSSELQSLSRRELLLKLKITEVVFKSMVFAVIKSAAENKRIYIILDLPFEELYKYSRLLLNYLLSSVPYHTRRRVGFTTYRGGEFGVDYLNITFAGEPSIATDREELRNGYVFNFINGEIKSFGQELEKHEYIKFVMDNINGPEYMKGFYEFVEDLLPKEVEESHKLSIDNYDKLSCLYKRNSGVKEVAESLSYINHFINMRGLNEKKVITLFLEIVAEETERMRVKKVLEKARETLEAVIPMYGTAENTDSAIEQFIVEAVHICEPPELFLIFKEIEKRQDIQGNVMSCMLSMYTSCTLKFIGYLKEEKLNHLNSISEIEHFIETGSKIYPAVINEELYINFVVDKIQNLIENSTDKLRMLESCVRMKRGESNLSTRLDLLNIDLFKNYVDKLSIASITVGEIKIVENIYKSLDKVEEYKEKIKAFSYMRRLLENEIDEYSYGQLLRTLKEVSEQYRSELQERLRKEASNDFSNKSYRRIIIAFLDLDTLGGDVCRFDLLLNDLGQYECGEEAAAAELLIWAAENDHINEIEAEAIKKYLLGEKSLFRNKAQRKKLLKSDREGIYKPIYKQYKNSKKSIPKKVRDFIIEGFVKIENKFKKQPLNRGDSFEGEPETTGNRCSDTEQDEQE